MNAEFRNRQLPYSSPLANVLVVLVGIVAIAVSFVVGVFALLALVVSVIVLGAVIRIRGWWLRRRRQRGTAASAADPGRDATVIEGEYRVISRQKKRQRRFRNVVLAAKTS